MAGTDDAIFDTTLRLLLRARGGDTSALDEIFARQVPDLHHWASGRLPRWTRSALETQDLVQEALVATFRRIDDYEHRGAGGLKAYLRQAVMNRVRDELRKAARRGVPVALDESLVAGLPAEGPSPFEAASQVLAVEQYEAALEALSEEERDVIVARLELHLTYAAIAEATGKPSPDAARMAVSRALVKLAEAMRGSEPVDS